MVRRNSKRTLTVFAALVVMTIAATPAFAVDNGSQCYVCKELYRENGTTYDYCADPDSNDWGYSECDMTWLGCIAEGDLCYYVEVRPR
jgi:hypothetical protein